MTTIWGNGMLTDLKARFHGVRWKTHVGTLYVRAWLRRVRLRQTLFVGITGSAGKTTTKDLCSLILSNSGPTICSVRSRNTPDVVAETILATTRETRFCVVELGESKPGALRWPLKLMKPNVGVLTVIGRDHYKAFKSLEAIAAEISTLVEALPANGAAVLNGDDPLIRSIGERCKAPALWYGRGEGSTLQLLTATSRWPEPLRLTVVHEGRVHEVRTQLHGVHLAPSVLAALGVALVAGVALEEAIPPLEDATTFEGRMEIVPGEDGVVFIRDDWKAPDWSLKAPLVFLKDAKADRKVAVVGTLSDYSTDASTKYKRAAREVREHADLVVFVGPHAHRALRAREHPHDESIQGFARIRDADAYLRKELRKGDLVLLKGSARADHLVRLMLNRYRPIECWQEKCGLNRFCGGCRELYRSKQAHSDIVPVSTEHQTAPVLNNSATTEMSTMYSAPVVVGLGNPGSSYDGTPHNVGYQLLDAIASAQGAVWDRAPEGWASAVVLESGAAITLFKPEAKMNHTGPKVRCFLDRIKVDASQCLVVHDDFDLELGIIRLKRDGGDSGHKGLGSVISALGTSDIRRVRIGVRQPGANGRARRQVLQRFSAIQEKTLLQSLDLAVQLIETELSEVSQ